MTRVGWALVIHELAERLRDRWVIVASSVFALLAFSVGLYGQTAGESAAMVTAPSLVTLCAFLVPLVALVLGHDAIVGERERNTLGLLLSLPVYRGEVVVAEFVGRSLALFVAIAVGLGLAAVQMGSEQASTLWALVPDTLLLGSAFLSLGVMISTLSSRVATAASVAVVIWFAMVFLYDLGLLALLVGTDGAVTTETVQQLVYANPAGLYRMVLLAELTGDATSTAMGIGMGVISTSKQVLLWSAWILGPLLVAVATLFRARNVS